MKVVCDSVPNVCYNCMFCRSNEYSGICCTLLNRMMARHFAVAKRSSNCPLVTFDEMLESKFRKGDNENSV